MKQITSLDNPLIKKIAKLATKKGREAEQLFLAEGQRTISTIIGYGVQPAYILADEANTKNLAAQWHNVEIIVVSTAILKKVSAAATPSGIIGVFPIPTPSQTENIAEGIVLANIQDPGNMGTLIRTCVAFGKKTVVVVEGVDPWSPKVIQSSAGTIAAASIFQLRWQELIALKRPLVALVVDGGKNPQDINFAGSLLVIGNEANGIPQEWLADCQQQMTIPMPGGTESLNAATAGALGMYLAWMK